MKIPLLLIDGQLVAHDTQLYKRNLNYSLWSPWLKSWLKASLGDPCCSYDRIVWGAKVIQEMMHRMAVSEGIKQETLKARNYKYKSPKYEIYNF